MAVQFHELPVNVFPEPAQPYIARLNKELRDLFGLEGTILRPLEVRRSDDTIARRGEQQVHVSRITPSISSSVAGTSTVIGTPALTFGLTNTVGTTRTVVSVNSAIRLFTTDNPASIAADNVASPGFDGDLAAHWSHVHDVTTQAPAFALGQTNTVGTGAGLVRRDAGVAIFDTTVPAALASTAATGSIDFAARRDHVHLFPISLRSTANASTLELTDTGTNQTLTGSLGNIIVNPSTSGHILLSNSTAITNRIAVGNLFSTLSKFQTQLNATATNQAAMEFLANVNASSINVNAMSGQIQTGTGSGVGNASVMRAFFPNIQIRGVSKTVGTVQGNLISLSFSSDDATTVLTNLVGLQMNTPTRGSSATITNSWGGDIQASPSWVTNAWTVRGVDKFETTGSDYIASTNAKGLITKDSQGTARYWRFYVDAATGTTGGATLSIDAAGTLTTSRVSGATGTINIQVVDVGTTLPQK